MGTRPKRPKGSSVHTITIGAGTAKGTRYFNIPTVVKGSKVSNRAAVEHFKKTKYHIGPAHKTQAGAVAAAKKFSSQLGRLKRTRHTGAHKGRVR